MCRWAPGIGLTPWSHYSRRRHWKQSSKVSYNTILSRFLEYTYSRNLNVCISFRLLPLMKHAYAQIMMWKKVSGAQNVWDEACANKRFCQYLECFNIGILTIWILFCQWFLSKQADIIYILHFFVALEAQSFPGCFENEGRTGSPFPFFFFEIC